MRTSLFLLLALATATAAATAPADAAGLIAAEPPPAILLDLSRADAFAIQIAQCAATDKKSGEWAALAQTSRAQSDAVFSRAQSLFGAISRVPLATRAPPFKCSRWSRRDARQAVMDLTRSVDSGLDALSGPTRIGLWFGLFPLCAQTVAEVTGQELANHGWAIKVRVRRDAAQTLGPYSARFVHPKAPPTISFRINGVLLSHRVIQRTAGLAG